DGFLDTEAMVTVCPLRNVALTMPEKVTVIPTTKLLFAVTVRTLLATSTLLTAALMGGIVQTICCGVALLTGTISPSRKSALASPLIRAALMFCWKVLTPLLVRTPPAMAMFVIAGMRMTGWLISTYWRPLTFTMTSLPLGS